jgi:hypothetical protein
VFLSYLTLYSPYLVYPIPLLAYVSILSYQFLPISHLFLTYPSIHLTMCPYPFLSYSFSISLSLLYQIMCLNPTPQCFYIIPYHVTLYSATTCVPIISYLVSLSFIRPFPSQQMFLSYIHTFLSHHVSLTLSCVSIHYLSYPISSCFYILQTSLFIPPNVSILSHLVPLPFIRPFLSHHMFQAYPILCPYPLYVLSYPTICFLPITSCVSTLHTSFSIPSYGSTYPILCPYPL